MVLAWAQCASAPKALAAGCASKAALTGGRLYGWKYLRLPTDRKESEPMKKAKIRIMIADDHAIVRDGIVSIMAAEKDLQLVAQAADGVTAVELVKKHLPDILLLD